MAINSSTGDDQQLSSSLTSRTLSIRIRVLFTIVQARIELLVPNQIPDIVELC